MVADSGLESLPRPKGVQSRSRMMAWWLRRSSDGRVVRARGSGESVAVRRKTRTACCWRDRSPDATLRGKLTEKVKYRPTAAIEPLLPAGTDALDDLPAVRPGVATYDLVRSEPTNEELTEYGENT